MKSDWAGEEKAADTAPYIKTLENTIIPRLVRKSISAEEALNDIRELAYKYGSSGAGQKEIRTMGISSVPKPRPVVDLNVTEPVTLRKLLEIFTAKIHCNYAVGPDGAVELIRATGDGGGLLLVRESVAFSRTGFNRLKATSNSIPTARADLSPDNFASIAEDSRAIENYLKQEKVVLNGPLILYGNDNIYFTETIENMVKIRSIFDQLTNQLKRLSIEVECLEVLTASLVEIGEKFGFNFKSDYTAAGTPGFKPVFIGVMDKEATLQAFQREIGTKTRSSKVFHQVLDGRRVFFEAIENISFPWFKYDPNNPSVPTIYTEIDTSTARPIIHSEEIGVNLIIRPLTNINNQPINLLVASEIRICDGCTESQFNKPIRDIYIPITPSLTYKEFHSSEHKMQDGMTLILQYPVQRNIDPTNLANWKLSQSPYRVTLNLGPDPTRCLLVFITTKIAQPE